MQIIAPVVEGSTASLGELVDLVDAKLQSTFDDGLDPYKEVLRSTEDILESEFSQVNFLTPESIHKLQQLQMKVPIVTSIWQSNSQDLLHTFYKASDIKQVRQQQKQLSARIELMIDIVHTVENTTITDEASLEKKHQKLKQMWTDEYQQQMKKQTQQTMQLRRKTKV